MTPNVQCSLDESAENTHCFKSDDVSLVCREAGSYVQNNDCLDMNHKRSMLLKQSGLQVKKHY